MKRAVAGAGVLLVLFCGPAMAAGAPPPGILLTLLKWTPYLAHGFVWNLVIGGVAMAVGSVLGLLLGIALVVTRGTMRAPFWLVTQILRNSPWLVLLFYAMDLVPYQFDVLGNTIALPAWLKAAFGFALPVTGYVAEITRGGLQSIPTSQWESAESLGFSRWQTLFMVIVPQSFKRMLPPWMGLYANVTMATVLANVVGVTEALTAAREILNAEGRTELLLPVYGYVMVWFLLYCSAIAQLTRYLERRSGIPKSVKIEMGPA